MLNPWLWTEVFFSVSGWTWQKPNLKAFRFQMFCYFGALWNSTESGLSFRRTRRQSRCAVVDLQIPICQWLIMLYSQLIYIYVCDNIIDVIYVLQHSCDFSEVKPTMNGVDPCLLFASGSKGRSFPKAKGGPFPWQKVDRSGHASAVVSVFQGSRWCLLVDISRYFSIFLFVFEWLKTASATTFTR